VEGVDKKRARLNCIHHLLQQVPYQEVPHDPIVRKIPCIRMPKTPNGSETQYARWQALRLAMARSCRIGSVGALTFWRIVIFSGKPASIFPGHA
jgi:hypothetical protein